MDWNAVTLLRNKKKELGKFIQAKIRENYPNRTTEYKKCVRDVQYIVQALSTCIQSNDTLAIDHLVKVFYLGDTLQLKTIHVELEMYDILKVRILEMFDNTNISEQSKTIVVNGLELLKQGLKDGPGEINSDWDNRRNFKVFDSSVVIPTAVQERIETILHHAPMQTSGRARFSIMKLLPSDLHIKEFLATHFFCNPSIDRHELAVVTAPIVYLTLAHTEDGEEHFPDDPDLGSWDTKNFHIGMHGGAVLNYILTQGFDFSFIGCTADPGEEITQQWSDIIWERFGYKTNQSYSWPLVSLCIGKGSPIFDKDAVYTTAAGDCLKYSYTSGKQWQRKGNIIYY